KKAARIDPECYLLLPRRQVGVHARGGGEPDHRDTVDPLPAGDLEQPTRQRLANDGGPPRRAALHDRPGSPGEEVRAHLAAKPGRARAPQADRLERKPPVVVDDDDAGRWLPPRRGGRGGRPGLEHKRAIGPVSRYPGPPAVIPGREPLELDR